MQTDISKSIAKVARYLALLPLVSVPWIACEDAPVFYNTSREPRSCDSDCDCYSGDNYELGTRCTERSCLCPVPGHYRVPCCQKGAPELDCNRQCRPIEECDPADIDAPASSSAASTSSTGTSTSGGGGGPSVPGTACKGPGDCLGSSDPACVEAQCLDGICQVTFKPLHKIESQYRGDCGWEWCDGQGNLVFIPDGSDVYNDGRQCTIDHCQDVKQPNKPFPDGSPCPETGLGVCVGGECVACLDSMGLGCGNGFTCHNNRCVPNHCTNVAVDKNEGETDLDCGGPCNPCPVSYGCKVPGDCQEGVCVGGKCAPPLCSDGIKNDHETDVDCGGPPSCPRCHEKEGCNFPSDCESGICWVGECVAAACDDGFQNGDEVDTDCGGSCDDCPKK